MAGLFDFNYEDPQQVGQYGFAAGLLNAAGPSRMPISTGQAIAQGLVARQQAAAESMQNQRRNMLVDAQIRETLAQAEQRRAMALALQQKAEQEQQANLWYANPANFMRQSAPMAGAPGEGETPTVPPATPLSQQEIAMNMARAPSPDIRRLGIAALVKPPGAGEHAPANIQEWQIYSQMTPDQQAAYREMKRQEWQPGMVGGIPTLIPRSPGAAPQPLSTLGAEAEAKRVKAEAGAIGTKGGESKVAAANSYQDLATQLPTLEKNANALINHPGLGLSVGAASVLPSVLPAQRDFIALHNQLLGTVFMEAYNTLKGGGQITEVEGKKATEAKARIDRAQTPEAYKQGVKDFISAVKAGMEKMKNRAEFPSGYATPQAQSEAVRRAGGMPGDRVDLVPGSTLPSDPLGIR